MLFYKLLWLLLLLLFINYSEFQILNVSVLLTKKGVASYNASINWITNGLKIRMVRKVWYNIVKTL